MRKLLLLLLAACAATPLAFAATPHVLLREAFVPRHDSARVETRTRPHRSRFVHADVTPLTPAALGRGARQRAERMLSVALFENVRLQVELTNVERTPIGSYVWTGRIAGDPRGTAIVAVHDGAMTATFTTSEGAFEVRPSANGLHEAREIDHNAFPDESEPIASPTSTRPLASDAGTSEAVAAADGETIADVLVVYTHVVRQGYGGTAAVQSLITSAIASTNTAYAASGVQMRVRLVGTAEVQYDDTTTDFYTTLQRLTSSGDGHLDSVHTLRDDLGADEVAMLVWQPTDNSCGIGWVGTPNSGYAAPYAFNVTRDDCAVSNLSFAHEMGHNFGLAHDRANAGSASLPYAYGYQEPNRLFRTVMAYNCPNGGCPRIGHFSNPAVLHNGVATGVHYLATNSADNARALNDNRLSISQWRPTVIPVEGGGTTFTDDPLVAGKTVVKAVHITELRNAIDARRNAAGLPAMSWTGTTLAGTRVSATHIAELRSALAATLPQTPAFTDPSLTSSTYVKAVHIQELRDLVD